MKKSIEQWDCFSCDEPVGVTVITGDAEDSPEFYAGPTGSFITVVDYDGEDSEFVVCCSELCCTEFFSSDEEDEEPDAPAEDGLQ
jgi:hypothetical protein